jgi:hypothetical protein
MNSFRMAKQNRAFGPNLQLNIDLLLRVALTGTCFIQKIYAPSSSLSKEEEGAYIF